MRQLLGLKESQFKNVAFVFDEVKYYKDFDAEQYVMDKLKVMGFEVKKSPERNRGIPDFTCKYKSFTFFIEVKSQSDGLRLSQVKWMLDNPKEVIYIYYVINKLNPEEALNEYREMF